MIWKGNESTVVFDGIDEAGFLVRSRLPEFLLIAYENILGRKSAKDRQR